MKCVDTILRLLALSNGEGVLLRASQVPLMMTGTSQSPLPLPALTVDQMAEIVADILPLAVRAQLGDRGSVDYTVPAAADRPELSMTAIGNGDDVWLEVRPQLPAAAHAGTTTAPRAEPPAARADAPAAGWPDAVPAPAAPRLHRITTAHDLNALIGRLASQGDSSLFLHSAQPPAAKINGTVEWLEEYEALDSDDLGRILVDLSGEIARNGGIERDDTLSWTIPEVAIVECRANLTAPSIQVSFRIKSTRPAAPAELSVPDAVLGVCRDEYGLLVLAGPDQERVGRTCHGLIEVINCECRHHVIMLERVAVTRHPRGLAFLSHRVVSGDDEAWSAAVTAALGEAPDVLVLQQIPSWTVLEQLMPHARDMLIIVQTEADSVVTAVQRLVADVPAAEQAAALGRLADALTAAVAQREVKPRGAAAVSAYEVMLATPGVRELLRQGAFEQLALTLERGADGMIPMSSAIAELTRTGRIGGTPGQAAPSRRAPAPPAAAERRRTLSVVAAGGTS